jgi:hypothetical protein
MKETMEQSIRKLIQEATKYPLSLRIAAKFVRTVRAGTGEESWLELDLSDLPYTFRNEIHNFIRDIEKGSYNVCDIPNIHHSQ